MDHLRHQDGTNVPFTRTVITGASSGLGRAFARRFRTDSASVVLVGRDHARLKSVAAEVAAGGADAEVVVADLTDEPSLRALEERLAQSQPDLLVNAAGLALFGPFAQLNRDQAELHVRVNILALMRLTHAAVPGMASRGRGAIINVSSLMHFDDRGGFTSYLATKAFVTRFTENLAVELDGSGVRLQALCPGPVSGTEFFERAGFDPTVFPPEVVMDPDDVVEASLAALEQREVLCIPGLQDPAMLDAYRSARLGVLREGRRGALAARYRSADSASGAPQSR